MTESKYEHLRPVDIADALTYARCQLTGDLEGMAVLLTHGDTAAMLVAATSVLNGLALRHMGGDQNAVLDFLDGVILANPETDSPW